jgi:hypothetical protein
MKYSLRSLMRFSIRDLLWITVVVAILLAWWVDHREEYRWRQRAGALEQLMYEWDWHVRWGRASVTIVFPDSTATFIRIPSAYMPSDFVSDDPPPDRLVRGRPNLPNSSAPAPNPPKP